MNDENSNISKDEKVPAVKREGWNMQEVAEEGVNEHPDDVVRRTLREDEGKREGDKQDIAGSVDSSETPQGREESKK